MSKYHVLKSFDSQRHFDEEENSSASNTITLTTGDHHLRDIDLLKHKNYSQQTRYLNNQYFGYDGGNSNHCRDNHRDFFLDDLSQYNKSEAIDDSDFQTTDGVNSSPIINTDTDNLITTSDFNFADDSTMEIPLLKQTSTNSETKTSDGYKHHHKAKRICLCRQKGFAFNLNTETERSAKSRIIWAIALCCIFMVIEFLGGLIAGSLAIMTDAAHLASDCFSFIIGLIAIWLGCKPSDAKMSFGYKRFEVVGAFVSILSIWILTATLVLVAIQRIYTNDYDLDASTMMTISGIGIFINIIMIFILHTPVLDLSTSGIGSSHGHSHSHNHNSHYSHSYNSTPSLRRCSDDSDNLHTELATRSVLPACRDDDVVDTSEATSMKLNGNLLKHQQDGHGHNLNLRAAIIHVVGDLVQSIGVFLAAILIKLFPKAAFLDPLCTLLFSVIVIMTTTNLFKESLYLLMDAVPLGFSVNDLETDLLNIDGVKSVHHLNVWKHTSNFNILMVHLVIDISVDSNTVLKKATHVAGGAKYNIKHSSIQIERVTS